MDTNVNKDKQYVIRYYWAEESYETLGIATGKNEQDAIEAFLGREENKYETRKLTADECPLINLGENNGTKQS